MGRFWCATYDSPDRLQSNNTEPKPWLVYDPCDMELFNVIAFGFALYANMLILIYVKCISTRNPSPRRLLFRGHSARCTVNTIACLVEFALAVDYALSTCGSMVLASVGLLAQLSSGLVCYTLEVAGQPGPMGFGVISWLVCGLSRALLFVSLADAGFAVPVYVRPPALALSAACCYANAALHLYAMIRKSKMNKTDLDLEFFTYKHDLCSWYSRVTFYWLTGFLRNCYKHLIQLEDLGHLPTREKSTTQYGRLYDIYLKQKEMYGTSTKVSMWKCYCKAYWKEFLLGGILKMMGDFVGYIGPLGVSVIVNFVAKKHSDTQLEPDDSCCVTFWEFLNNGYVMAFIMLISCIAQGSFSQASTHILNVEGIRLKSGLQAMLYCKMLKLQQTQVDSTSENGHIINLLSEDTTNIMSSFWIGHYIWAIPLKVCIVISNIEFYKNDIPTNGVNAVVEFDLYQKFCCQNYLSPHNAIDALNLCNDTLFLTIFILLKIFSTLPVSTSTSERSFSTSRRIKTYLRNTMSQNRLNELAMIHIHVEIDAQTSEGLSILGKKGSRYNNFTINR